MPLPYMRPRCTWAPARALLSKRAPLPQRRRVVALLIRQQALLVVLPPCQGATNVRSNSAVRIRFMPALDALWMAASTGRRASPWETGHQARSFVLSLGCLCPWGRRGFGVILWALVGGASALTTCSASRTPPSTRGRASEPQLSGWVSCRSATNSLDSCHSPTTL